MKYLPNTIYHIYNQGNNQQPIFFNDENYLFFLRKMRKHLLGKVDFLAYCLMPNHFHWLVLVKPEGCLPSSAVQPRNIDGRNGSKWTEDSKSSVHYSDYQQKLSKSIGTLLSSYTRAINKQNNTKGSLFRSRTKAKNGIIDGFITVNGKNKDLFFKPDNHYEAICLDYIHQNPVKAKLVSEPEDWLFSSASDYAGLRNGTLCNQQLARKLELVR